MTREYDTEKTQAPPPDRMDEEKFYRANPAKCGRPLFSEEEILAKLFAYHPPTILSRPKYVAINQAAKNFAEVILQNCPPSADRSDAIRQIRNARMTANASIALDGLSL